MDEAALAAFRVEQASHVRLPYMIIAGALLVLAGISLVSGAELLRDRFGRAAA